MKLTWTAFSGIRPKVDARLLPEGAAQAADNINTERGGLRPIEGLQDIMALVKAGVVKTIYRFGQGIDSATQFWFHWTGEVDVVKGPINNDTSERTYWTGDGGPKYTTAQAGTSGADLPSTWFPLGVSFPNAKPALAAIGEFTATAATETRVYVYTFVTVNGEESAPSAPTSVEIHVGQGVLISDMLTAADNAAVLTHKRIYRAQRGVYLFVAEIASSATSFSDTVSSDALSEPCPSVDWDMPPDSMYGLHSGPNGMMIALDGYDVCLCEPFRPHAWPASYRQTMPYPTVGIGQFGQSFVILTRGLPSILTGTHPANMSVSSAEFYQPCLSRRSIVSAAGSVIWASPDGLVAIGASGEQNLTAALFTPKQWRALNPETLIGAWHEDWYIGTFEQNGERTGFMFRISTQEWVNLPGLRATAMYRDTVGDALYVCVGNRIQKFRAGDPVPYNWLSQKVVTPLTDFVAARVTGTYPVSFTLRRNNKPVLTKRVMSDEPFKLPAGLGNEWEIGLAGTNEVLGVVLATSEAET